MRRATEKVTLAVARERLEAYREKHGPGPHKAQWLGYAIWPTTEWRAAQGAGAAASRVLKRLGCRYGGNRLKWGWVLVFGETKGGS